MSYSCLPCSKSSETSCRTWKKLQATLGANYTFGRLRISTQAQIEWGWQFFSALTKADTVFIFWSFEGKVHEAYTASSVPSSTARFSASSAAEIEGTPNFTEQMKIIRCTGSHHLPLHTLAQLTCITIPSMTGPFSYRDANKEYKSAREWMALGSETHYCKCTLVSIVIFLVWCEISLTFALWTDLEYCRCTTCMIHWISKCTRSRVRWGGIYEWHLLLAARYFVGSLSFRWW